MCVCVWSSRVLQCEEATRLTSETNNNRYLVVDGGIDPTTANQYGMTPLHFAVMNKDVKMALMLVKNGADPHFQNNVGQSPLSLAEDMPDMKQLVQSLKRHVSVCVCLCAVSVSVCLCGRPYTQPPTSSPLPHSLTSYVPCCTTVPTRC